MNKPTRSLRAALAAALLGLAGCVGAPLDEAEPAAPQGSVSRSQAALISTCSDSTPIDPLKELFIVDPSVVNSAEANNAGPTGGLLSFHRTMRTLAAGQDVALFTERFFENWETTQPVGRGVAEARPAVSQLLDPELGLWPRLPDGRLDMEKAPLRLLGIANRMDLFGTAPDKPNGEGRLIYGVFAPGDETRDPARGSGLPFTIIFEFNLPASRSLRDWAERWHAMGALDFGQNSSGRSAMPFNVLLFQNVVNEFVAPQNLSQVRTNEILLGGPWQLREFALVGGALRPSTTKQSPEPSLNDSPELIDWVKANKNAILSNTHVVPGSLLGGTANQGFPRVCGRGCVPAPDTFDRTRWLIDTAAASGIEESVRFAFASQTCNGCHNSDVGPSGNAGVIQFFYQVAPTLGAEGDGSNRLSDFIKTQELPARSKVLSGLVSCNCIASYRVISSWDTGTTSSVRVTNIGNQPTSTWNVKWAYASNERVTSHWEAARVTSGVSLPDHEFHNLGWNGSLAPGQSVQFGLNTQFSGLAPVPAELVASCQ